MSTTRYVVHIRGDRAFVFDATGQRVFAGPRTVVRGWLDEQHLNARFAREHGSARDQFPRNA